MRGLTVRRYFGVPALVCSKPLLKDTLLTRRPALAGLLERVRATMPADQLSAMRSWSGYGGFTGNAQWMIDFPALFRLAGATVRRRIRFPHVSN